jgi:rubredoxin-NAD+ reductase
MYSARALATTLAGEKTAVQFPIMPVVIKTPAHSIVVVPPDEKENGLWQVTEADGGMQALYYDEKEALKGFILTGACVDQRQLLVKKLGNNTG